MTNMYPVQLELPSSVKGNGPTLATLVEVAHILEKAKREPPLSLAEIGRRMEARQTRHATVKACIDFLEQLGYVTALADGALWVHNTNARSWKTVPLGR